MFLSRRDTAHGVSGPREDAGQLISLFTQQCTPLPSSLFAPLPRPHQPARGRVRGRLGAAAAREVSPAPPARAPAARRLRGDAGGGGGQGLAARAGHGWRQPLPPAAAGARGGCGRLARGAGATGAGAGARGGGTASGGGRTGAQAPRAGAEQVGPPGVGKGMREESCAEGRVPLVRHVGGLHQATGRTARDLESRAYHGPLDTCVCAKHKCT